MGWLQILFPVLYDHAEEIRVVCIATNQCSKGDTQCTCQCHFIWSLYILFRNVGDQFSHWLMMVSAFDRWFIGIVELSRWASSSSYIPGGWTPPYIRSFRSNPLLRVRSTPPMPNIYIPPLYLVEPIDHNGWVWATNSMWCAGCTVGGRGDVSFKYLPLDVWICLYSLMYWSSPLLTLALFFTCSSSTRVCFLLCD